jgi:Protein of unknown function (DUF2786)
MAALSILNKVKLLLKLTQSPNPHEAESAQKLADGLIEKHNISPEELESLKDPKPLYGEDEKIFGTIGLVSWKQKIALAIGNHFECQIVVEELVPNEGDRQYHYFAYGDPADVKKVQYAWRSFVNKVEKLIDVECLGRGPVYIESYCEGVVDAIKENILTYGIKIPDQLKQRVKTQVEKAITLGGDALVKAHAEKPKAAERRVDVNSQGFIRDIVAYFKGVDDGSNLLLQEEPEEITQESWKAKELKDQT